MLCSTRVRTIPLAARRRAKGSLEPEGIMPRANIPAMVSALSAMASTAPSSERGTCILHGGGLVLIVDGLADGRGGAFGKLHALGLVDEVETADDALEFGELLHQFGGEIALGHERGLVHHALAVSGMKFADGGADQAAQVLGARGLVVVAAEFLLEGDRLEHGHAILEGELLIGVPEEARIVEAGAQNALIAVAHDGFAFGIGHRVEHGEEVRREFAVGIFHGEVLLVIAHDGDQDFFGKGEKFAVEVAEDDRRRFGEIDDRVEQFLIFTPARAGNFVAPRRRGLCGSCARARRSWAGRGRRGAFRRTRRARRG